MKKVIVLTVFAILASAAAAENYRDELPGFWVMEPFIIEREDGLVVNPEAEYSYPYRGITGMNFLDGSLVVIYIKDEQYRAFYEAESLDFDNYSINCSFKNGEGFTVKLAREAGGQWRYMYRIVAESVLNGITAPGEEDAISSEAAAEPWPAVSAGLDNEDSNRTEGGDAEESVSLYAGIMKRQ